MKTGSCVSRKVVKQKMGARNNYLFLETNQKKPKKGRDRLSTIDSPSKNR